MKKIILLTLLIGLYVASHGMTFVTIYYLDADQDGYGDPANSIEVLDGVPPPGYVINGDDCNDSNSVINPGSPEIPCNVIDDDCDGVIDQEVCNGLDDNCNAMIDEGVMSVWCTDFDMDGHEGINYLIVSCSQPYGWMLYSGYQDDEEDWDPNSTGGGDPYGRRETCNGIDDDGDGLIDGDDPGLSDFLPWYADADGDGYGNPNVSVITCPPPGGYVPWPNFVDCDDANPAVHENCNSIDTDCDGVPDNLDICPGGDDSLDNNADGIADCSQLLDYNDYSPDWHCGTNKIYVCHNDNNPQTICVDANSLLPAHYSHGDWIGPCASCPQNLIQPGNPKPSSHEFQVMIAGENDRDLNDSGSPYDNDVMHGNGDVVLLAMPNPADEHVEVHTNFTPNVICVMDMSGKTVLHQVVSGNKNILNTGELMEGIYFLRIQSGADCFVRSIVVMH